MQEAANHPVKVCGERNVDFLGYYILMKVNK